MNPSAAFSVRLHENTVLTDSPCVYETVDVNIGDGYDEFTGKSDKNMELSGIFCGYLHQTFFQMTQIGELAISTLQQAH